MLRADLMRRGAFAGKLWRSPALRPASKMNSKIEREKWSESSKRSYVYYSAGTEYGDIVYTCEKCSAQAVFTGEQQKESYEVKKNYIWQQRRLCGSCNAELYRLKVKNLACQASWAQDKARLQKDVQFMAEWLAVIKAFPLYGSRIGGTMGQRLEKLLTGISEPSIDKNAPEKPGQRSQGMRADSN